MQSSDNQSTPALVLAPGRERSLLRHHPWIFSGAVQRVVGRPDAGDTVDVLDAAGTVVARAAYSPRSRIRGRVWSFDPDETIDADFFRRRIRQALALRHGLALAAVTDSFRIIHGESDGLPGLVVDRYGPVLVLQALAAGAERWKHLVAEILLEETDTDTVFERSDAEVRRLEGLEPVAGLLAGRAVSPPVIIREHDLSFRVDFTEGQKTGFFLDQRDNRLLVRRLAAGRDVLDCFCYTGGFTCNAVAGGARSVLAVDSSDAALAGAMENLQGNTLDAGTVAYTHRTLPTKRLV